MKLKYIFCKIVDNLLIMLVIKNECYNSQLGALV